MRPAIIRACVSIGVAAVGMNAWWTAEELEFALKDSAPRVVFCDKERLARISECGDAAAGIRLVGVRIDPCPEGVVPYADVIAGGGAMPQVSIDPDSDACIFYTSGTTGFPKGAQLTHRGCVANLMNMLYSTVSQALAIERATGVAPPAEAPIPVSLLTTPLFHVTANNCGAYLSTAAGGLIVLMYKWDAGEALKLWHAHAIDGQAPAGQVVRADADGVVVGSGGGLVVLTQLQAAGGKRLAARAAAGEVIAMPEGYVQRMHEAYSTFFHAYEAAPLLIVNTDHLDLVEGEEDFGLLLRCISEMRGQRSYFNKGI